MAKRPRFRLTPWEPAEDQLQQAVADLLEWAVPEEVVWTHFPAGGYLLTAAAKARLYRLGLKPGMPDLIFWWRCNGGTGVGECLGIELKTLRGRTSENQKEMHPRLRKAGVPVEICRSVAEVLTVLRKHGVPLKAARLAA